MTNRNKILIGVVAAVAVGTVAYAMAGGSLLQGRLQMFGSKQPAKVTYSKLPCLTPSEWDKKYNTQPTPGTNPPTDTGTNGTPVVGTPGTPGSNGHQSGGGSTSTDPKKTDGTDTSTTTTSGNGGDDSKKPVVINPGTITGTGSTGGTVAKGGSDTSKGTDGTYSSPAQNGKGPQTNYVECSCARQGFKYITKDAQGKDVHNECYVSDWLKCVPPEFQCPDGTQIDYPSLYDLCKNKKKKSCFSAKGPDNTSKDDAMCKALLPSYKSTWTCVMQSQCDQLSVWAKDGTMDAKIQSGQIDTKDMQTCADLYGSKY